jgi:signal transduction histidine kinase
LQRLIFLCIAGLLLSPLPAQTGRVEYFSVTDGLASREINDLHVGQDGYLWAATIDGLSRFDGQAFLNFGPGYREGDQLSRSDIASIRASNDRHLILTFNDFYGYFDRFDPRDFSVEQVRLVPSTGIKGYPRAIETDGLGRTYIVTIGQDGTLLYEYTGAGFEIIYQQPDDSYLSLTPRIELLPLRNGQYLLYDEEHGIRHISAAGKVLDRFFPRTARQRRFYTMAEGPDGTVYLSFQDGIPLFSWRPGAGRKPEPVRGLDQGLRYPRVYRDELGQLLWLGTEDILGQGYPDEYYLLDTAGNFDLVERDLPTDVLVSSLAALNFRETVYLGLREGLGVMERYAKPIRSYLTNQRSGRLYQHRVRGIAQDASGHTYVMEADGPLHQLRAGEQELRSIELVDSSGNAIAVREAGQLQYDPGRNLIWGIAQNGRRLRGGLLFAYSVDSGYTQAYPLLYTLSSLTVDRRGRIFVAASEPSRTGILLEFDPLTGRHTELESSGVGETIDNLRITFLTVSENGELLIGTRLRGLVGFDVASRRLRYIGGGGITGDASAYAINCVRQDSLGRYWLGTDAGLRILDPRTGQVLHYSRQDGLSSSIVVGIVPDSAGGHWLSTHNGLVHMPSDSTAGTIRRYYQEDGLVNNEFNPFAYGRDRGGRYFFGGDEGLSVFRDEDLSSAEAGSDVMLTEVVIYGRGENRILNRNLDDLEEITVSPSEKSIAISFALPVGQRPSVSQYRVKLEGFDEKWQELRNERTVRYNNLPAGRYRLQVLGAGANGNYGEQMRTLGISVRQYLYERTWFQLLVIFLIAGLFFFILQARLRERLRNERLRTQLSSDIHDEVSGLLAGITLQAELLQHRTEDDSLRARLKTVGDAGRNAMSKMSDVIWSIDSRRDTIGNLLQRMQEHADEVLLPLDIRYDFRSEGFILDRELPGSLRQDLYFIFKEAINNIARHSQATHVQIELEQFGQTFEMFIRDNGVGKADTEDRPLSSARFTPKTGQGTDNMRMRAKRINATLAIDYRNGYTLTLQRRRLY